MKEQDQVGLTTSKPARASRVTNQEAINQHTSNYLENIQDQLDNMTQAMSVLTQSPPPSGVPTIIQTSNSNTSALGTTDQSYRLLMEERNKHNIDKAAMQNKIRELEHLLAATATTVLSRQQPYNNGGAVTNEKIIHKDNT